MNITSSILIASLGCLAAAGCQSSSLYDENVALHRQNRDLQSQLDADNAQLRNTADPGQISALQAEIADRDKKIAELQSQPQLVAAVTPAPQPAVPTSIAGMETSVDARAGTMTITLPGDVLFDSGKADLKPSAQTKLDKVADVLKSDYNNKKIRVEGHTDNDPITKTKDDWEDNLDLSLARAAAVSRYLMQQGISPKLVTTSGMGSTHPRSSNKAKNRRVEIVVVTR
jgi:chemotaxis protein MotB